MLCRTYEDVEPRTKMKVQWSFETCETSHHIKKYDIQQIEILHYNALKTLEIQNPLFIIYKMAIKKFTL